MAKFIHFIRSFTCEWKPIGSLFLPILVFLVVYIQMFIRMVLIEGFTVLITLNRDTRVIALDHQILRMGSTLMGQNIVNVITDSGSHYWCHTAPIDS